MAKRKNERRSWTEQEMRDLIDKVNGRPSDVEVGKWIEQQGISQSSYRSMKKRYLLRYGKAKAAPVVALAKQQASPATDFRNAPKGVKRQMLVEYNNLPDGAKAQWRDDHNITQALTSYYNRQLFKNSSSRQGPHSTKKFEDSEIPALLSEYLSLEVPGSKGVWLKAHNLNHQNIHDWKKRLAKANGNDNLPAVRITHASYSHTPPIHTPAQPPSLQDGVNYLAIKRDIYAEVIEDLKRVLAGAR